MNIYVPTICQYLYFGIAMSFSECCRRLYTKSIRCWTCTDWYFSIRWFTLRNGFKLLSMHSYLNFASFVFLIGSYCFCILCRFDVWLNFDLLFRTIVKITALQWTKRSGPVYFSTFINKYCDWTNFLWEEID